MKLTVQSEKCIACGKCYLNFPEVFDCDDTGIAFVSPDAHEDEQAAATKAVYDCPTRAISIVDNKTTRLPEDSH